MLLLPFVLALAGILLTLQHRKRPISRHPTEPLPASPTTSPKRKLRRKPVETDSPKKAVEPVQKFAYVKTHKTGSTSVWYVMKLYAMKHRLRVVIPTDGVHLGYPKHLRLSDSRMYRQTHDLGDYDVLIDHCRYNKAVMDKLIKKPVYITILRDPITRFVSTFYFYGTYRRIAKNQTVGQYLSHIRAGNDYEKPLEKWAGFNGMAFDLGVNPPYKDKNVKRKIHEIDKTFALVLIMEYMPESMVLLKRTMGWKLEDVIGIPQNTHPDFASKSSTATDRYAAHRGSETLNDKQKETLAKLSHADMKMYRHFNGTFWKRIRSEYRFREEVELYREMLEMYLKEMESRGMREQDVRIARKGHRLKYLPSFHFH